MSNPGLTAVGLKRIVQLTDNAKQSQRRFREASEDESQAAGPRRTSSEVTYLADLASFASDCRVNETGYGKVT